MLNTVDPLASVSNYVLFNKGRNHNITTMEDTKKMKSVDGWMMDQQQPAYVARPYVHRKNVECSDHSSPGGGHLVID